MGRHVLRPVHTLQLLRMQTRVYPTLNIILLTHMLAGALCVAANRNVRSGSPRWIWSALDEFAPRAAFHVACSYVSDRVIAGAKSAATGAIFKCLLLRPGCAADTAERDMFVMVSATSPQRPRARVGIRVRVCMCVDKLVLAEWSIRYRKHERAFAENVANYCTVSGGTPETGRRCRCIYHYTSTGWLRAASHLYAHV